MGERIFSRLKKAKERKLKFLVIRPDRIGDVVLSTPVFQALKNAFPGSEVHTMVRETVVPIVRHNPFISRVITYRPNSVHWGLMGFWRLWRAIRREQYDVTITLQVQGIPTLALFLAGVPHRVGPYSKWYSYLLFNRGLRQSRSQVAMHEADYNLLLLRRLGIRVPSRKFDPHIVVDADAKERMREFVRRSGFEDGTSFIVVHPGMGGSALNWPEGYYVDLIKRLSHRGVHVFVTGSASERTLVEKVVSEACDFSTELPVYAYVGENSDAGLSDFIALLSLSQVVVAPSTGPLHIATALGKRTVSFYPPIRVQSVLRWGPYSSNESRHDSLVPDAICGQDFKCAGPKCFFYYCMERLSVEEAVTAVMGQLENTKI